MTEEERASGAKRLTVTEHHSESTPSEVVRVDVDTGEPEPFRIVIEHLGSQRSIVVDFVYPDETRIRHEHLYY